MSDKASVREYVESCGFGDLLNECYGVYDRVEDINWDALPNQFVLKNTLGGSSNGIHLVFDKNTLDIDKTKEELRGWIEKGSFAQVIFPLIQTHLISRWEKRLCCLKGITEIMISWY